MKVIVLKGGNQAAAVREGSLHVLQQTKNRQAVRKGREPPGPVGERGNANGQADGPQNFTVG